MLICSSVIVLISLLTGFFLGLKIGINLTINPFQRKEKEKLEIYNPSDVDLALEEHKEKIIKKKKDDNFYDNRDDQQLAKEEEE